MHGHGVTFRGGCVSVNLFDLSDDREGMVSYWGLLDDESTFVCLCKT